MSYVFIESTAGEVNYFEGVDISWDWSTSSITLSVIGTTKYVVVPTYNCFCIWVSDEPMDFSTEVEEEQDNE
jgi:hypothetical protein